MKEKELESLLEETQQRLEALSKEYQNSKKELQALNKELREAKIYAESIIETLHEPFLVLHPDLRVRSANEAFYNHFEVHPQDTEGRLIYERVSLHKRTDFSIGLAFCSTLHFIDIAGWFRYILLILTVASIKINVFRLLILANTSVFQGSLL